MKKRRDGDPAGQPDKKEQKIVYIDDGSTVADMGGTYKKSKLPQSRASFKEQAKTFFTTMKKMVLPMLVTLLALAIVYVVVLVIANFR